LLGKVSYLLAGVRRLRRLPKTAIIDDIFPQPVSAFRIEEFTQYLNRFANVTIYTTGESFGAVNESRPPSAVIADYVSRYPQHRDRVLPLSRGGFPDADRYYAIFLNNIFPYLERIEKQKAGFAFSLYPGGGFALDQPDVDEKLRRIFASQSFVKVIVTQPIIRDYLLSKGMAPPELIAPVYGGVPIASAFAEPLPRRRYCRDKETFDLCFVANRYTPKGEDKGYDLFVEAAAALVRNGVPAHFHVVGPFDETIVELGALSSHFTFYGYRASAFFPAFYAGMDAILSPNRPFVLAPGMFDGFPTTSCMEAGLQEVVVICTDALRLNRDYTDGVDIVLVESNAGSVEQTVLDLARHPERVAAIGPNGRRTMLQVYSKERQIEPRLRVLRGDLGVR
jgi:glycosyltransferase involved in cell wall biosynthesis